MSKRSPNVGGSAPQQALLTSLALAAGDASDTVPVGVTPAIFRAAGIWALPACTVYQLIVPLAVVTPTGATIVAQIYADAAGAPGAVIARTPPVSDAILPPGSIITNVALNFDFTSNPRPHLNAGNYWISLTSSAAIAWSRTTAPNAIYDAISDDASTWAAGWTSANQPRLNLRGIPD